MKKIATLLILIIIIIVTISPAFAHPGRTDSKGGHYVRTEGWGYEVGSYHYHDGSSTGNRTSSKSFGDTIKDILMYLLLGFIGLSILGGLFSKISELTTQKIQKIKTAKNLKDSFYQQKLPRKKSRKEKKNKR